MTKLGGLRVDFEGDSKDLEVAAKRAKDSLAGVGRQAEATAGRQAKANKQSKLLAGSFGKLSNVSGQTRNSIRNATFQFQDIAVQMQMGTRMSTVLSQQLPQLGMSFGAVGLAAGTLAGIAAGVVGALSNLRGESKSLTENMDSLTEAIGRYNKASELATTTNAELIEKFGGINTEFRNLLGVLADVEASNALANFDTAMNSVVDSTKDMLGGLVEYGQMLAIAEGDQMQTAIAAGFLRDSIEQFGKSVGLTELQINKLLTPLRKLTEAEGPTEARIAVEEFFRAAEDAGVEVSNLDKNGRAFFTTLGEIATAAALIEPPLNDADVIIDSLSEGLGTGKTRLQEMADEAEKLAARLGISAKAVESIMGMQRAGGGRGGDPREAESALLRGMGGEFIARPEEKAKAKRRSALETDLERLQKNLATEIELAQTSFDTQAQVLQSALDERLITQQEFEELSLRSKKEYTDAMEDLDQNSFKSQIGFAGDFFGLMSGLMSSENKKLFNIGKAAAIGTALINTYKGISESLGKYPMPWAGAMAAAHAAVGFANVQKIRSTTFGGGGGGAASVPAIPSGDGGGTNTLVNVTLQGDTFGAAGVRGLLDQINDVIEDGGRIRLV